MKPMALKRNADRADALIAKAAQQRAEADGFGPTKAPEQPAPEPTAEIPSPAPAAEPDTRHAAQEEGGAGAAVPESPTAPARQPEPKPPSVDWEHKFRVLQGKYNAEVPGLHDKLRQALARVTALEEAQKAAPPASPITPVSDKEREEFGEDLIDVATRATLSHPEVARLIEDNRKLRDEVSRLGARVAATSDGVVRTARERMFDHLDEKVPNWRSLNTDPDFLAWLEQEEGLSGTPRMDLLTRAYEANDASRVVRFFATYAGQVPPPAQPAPKLDPEKFVSPGTGRGSAQKPPTAEKITWTPSSIAAFYADVRRGAYAKNPDLRDQLERDIFDAQAEGRVQV